MGWVVGPAEGRAAAAADQGFVVVLAVVVPEVVVPNGCVVDFFALRAGRVVVRDGRVAGRLTTGRVVGFLAGRVVGRTIGLGVGHSARRLEMMV